MLSFYFTSCNLQTHNLHILIVYVFVIGWEPGPQEGLIEWDEDWDKFEDEG